MRLAIVSPPFGAGRPQDKGLPIAPPILEYLGGLTRAVRPDVAYTLVDAHRRPFDPAVCTDDVVGISVLTPHAPWAYRVADTLRERGIQVILGGLHPSMLPEEASAHADAVVVGEAETVWAQVLDDAGAHRLERVYRGERGPLARLPLPDEDTLPDLYPFGSFFTARGCPHACGFCSVHEFFGNTVRLRPIDEVVAEVAASHRRLLFNLDDNVWGTDMDRSIELFREMGKQIHCKWWFGQADLAGVQRPRADEMLGWARRAGMITVMAGFESENPLVLDELEAHTKQGRDRIDAIKRIRSHGIDVVLFMMVGSRADTPRDFEAVRDLADRLDVAVHPVMTVPYPGTRLRDAYEPHLVPGLDWDAYDGSRALFYHDDPEMTPGFREHATAKPRAELFTWPRMLKRIRSIPLRGFPMAHIASFMVQYPQGRAFKAAAAEIGVPVPDAVPAEGRSA